MLIMVVLGTSVFLQLTAAIFALSLVRLTGIRAAWLLIAAAVSLMAARRTITLFRLVTGEESLQPDLVAELVALSISILMVAGIRYIVPVFKVIRQEHDTSATLANQNIVLAEIGRMIYSSLETKEVFERFSHEVAKLIRCEGLRIRTIDPDSGAYNVAYKWGGGISVDSGTNRALQHPAPSALSFCGPVPALSLMRLF